MNKPIRTVLVAAMLGAGVAAIGARAAETDHYKQGTAGVSPHEMGSFDERGMKEHNDQMEAHLKQMQTLMDMMMRTDEMTAKQP